MIDVLINLIFLCVVGGLLYWLITLLPLPAPFPMVIRVVFIVILILFVLGMLTGHVPRIRG